VKWSASGMAALDQDFIRKQLSWWGVWTKAQKRNKIFKRAASSSAKRLTIPKWK